MEKLIMSPKCSRCKKETNRLIHMDNAEDSAMWSGLLQVAYPSYDKICVSCALDQIGVDRNDFFEEDLHVDQSYFLLNLMKGNIAQLVVKTILQEFGYEVYPYGYENYLSSMSRSISTLHSNISARRIRSTPDLFVFDIKSKESFLVEVKSTTTKDESRCFIAKYKLDDYAQYWPEAILIMYCLYTGNLYCKRISDLKLRECPTNDRFGHLIYELNLKANFSNLFDVFTSIENVKYSSFRTEIQHILCQFVQ